MKPRKTKAEKRVEIAKDVIAQLKAEKFNAKTGTYVGLDEDIDGTKELQTELKKVKQCTVCALGALFLSDVRKNDACKGVDVDLGSGNDVDGFASRYIDEHRMRDRLGKLFSRKQMALIECAFELGMDPQGLLKDDEYERAARFGEKFDTSRDRLVGIMRNIIKNEGTFVLLKVQK